MKDLVKITETGIVENGKTRIDIEGPDWLITMIESDKETFIAILEEKLREYIISNGGAVPE